MSALKCPQQPQKPKKNRLPGSSIAARVRAHYDELIARAGVLTTAQQIELKLQREFSVKTLASAHIPLLKNYNKLESILAKDLGWKSWLWQSLNGGMTNAGAVRYALRDKAKLAVGLIQTTAQYKVLPDIIKLYGELNRVLPGIPKADLQNLLYDHVVIGNYPKLYNVMDSPVVKDQLIGRYNQHTNKLITMGVSQEAIATLDELSGRISEGFDTLRHLAGTEGFDVPALMNGGYFPLRAQEEAKRYLQALSETSNIGKKDGFIDIESFMQKSRATNVPLMLKTEELAQMLGMKELDLIDLVKEPGELSRVLNEKLKPEQIEKLFESGVLIQTPALSDELTEFFNESLDLPIKNLGEAIMLDPVKAVTDYADQLKEAVSKSTLVKDLLTSGIENEWIVDPSFVGGRNSRDYVRLGSSKMFMDAIPSTNLREEIAELYVHRTVADQLNSVLALNQSWADLGVIGQTIQKFIVPFTSLFRKAALLGAPVQYVKRVVTQDMIAVHAAVGHLGQVGIASAEVFRMKNFNTLDVFGKGVTAKVGGKDYPLKDVFEAMMMKRGGDFVSITGEEFGKIASPLTKFSFQRFMLFNKAYHARFGSPITGKINTAVDVVKEMMDTPFQAAYAVLAQANQLVDMTGRWAAVRTLATEQGDRFANLDELIRYTDEYFQINEDVGTFGKLYGAVGMPFASFAMAAPGSALRFTMQHPWRAGRMLSLYAQANSGSQLTDAEMKQWQKDDYVISVAHDPVTGKQYSVSPTSVDFYLSSYVFFREIAEDMGRSMGLNVGSFQEVVQQEKNPLQPLTDALQTAAKDTYLSALFPLFGIDPQTLEKLENPESEDTLIGVPMPRALRDTAIRLFPLLRSADEKWLPPSVVGRSRKVSPSFDVEQEPQAGWMGRTPSFGGNRERFNPDREEEPIAWFLKEGAGLTLSEIDPERNLVNTYNDFAERRTELSSVINKLRKRLILEAKTLSPQDKEALTDQYQNFLRLRFTLQYNQYLVDSIAEQRGLPKPTVLNKLQQKLGRFTAPGKYDDAKAFIQHYIGEKSSTGED